MCSCQRLRTASSRPPMATRTKKRRLAYVALTRGKRRVTISWAQYRRGPGEPSPFIADIPDEAKATVKASCDRALRPHLSHEKAAALRALGVRLSSF